MGTSARIVALLAAGTFAACITERDDRPDTGGGAPVEVAVSLAGAACVVASADATVSAYDMQTIGPVPLQVAGGTIQGTIPSVPAGSPRTVTVSAYDARGYAVYRGSTTVSVVAGQTTTANVVLTRTEVVCLESTGSIAVTGTIEGLAFSFTDATLTTDGVLHFFDAAADRIRRLDLGTREFLPDVSGTVTLDAVSMAVAPDGATAYLGYAGGRMDAVDYAAGTVSFFAAAAETVSTMVVAGDYLFTIDGSGAWDTQSLYHRATRARTDWYDWRDTSRSIAYSPVQGRVYFLDSGVSPTDVNMVAIDTSTGKLGAEVDSPYHGSYSLPNPLRLLPDESGVIVGSGIIFEAADLTYRSSVGLAFEDVAFAGGRLYLVDTIGDLTQLRVLGADFSILSADYVPGRARRVFAHGGELILVTEVAGAVTVTFATP